MDYLEIMKSRHSVRQYKDTIIEQEKREILDALASSINSKNDMNIQIIYDEPKCFNSLMAHYGHFSGCNNYISVTGKKSPDLDEKAGYFGELLVLKAQELGLNTCWVAMTHGKSVAKVEKGEKEAIIISLGYGLTQGVAHKNKELSSLSDVNDNSPEWYKKGMEAVMLAPTAINQQSFKFTLNGDKVTAISKGGPCNKIDLGIVKCHFELVSGHKVD